MPESWELSESECEALLAATTVGRVAVSTPDGPHLVPVNYAVVDTFVVIRTSPYSIIGTYGRDAVLAFEIDGVDPELERGWSVVVRGRAEFVVDPDELARIREQWPNGPWASGPRQLHLRLLVSTISGRRLGLDWDLMSGLAPEVGGDVTPR